LLLAEPGEQTTDYLEKRLQERILPYQRLNVEEFTSAKFNFQINQSEEKVVIGSQARFTGVFVKYHKPIGSKKLETVPQEFQKFVTLEVKDSLLGSLLCSDAVFINLPENSFASSIKVAQLRLARNVGFLIPDTLISTSKSELIKFWKSKQGNIVTKAIHQGWVADTDKPNEHLVMFTNEVNAESLVELEKINFPPILFQEAIRKFADLRVVVVGKKCFTSVIKSPSIDWRTDGPVTAKSSRYDLHSNIEKMCVELVENMGLQLGVIDLVIREDGEIFFLEINQQGGWLWMEQELNHPIRDAIIARLLGE